MFIPWDGRNATLQTLRYKFSFCDSPLWMSQFCFNHPACQQGVGEYLIVTQAIIAA